MNGKFSEILKSIGRGEVLFSLKFDKFFPHILFTFCLICLLLLSDVMIEKTMVRLEQNKKELYDMKVLLTNKNSELVGLGKLSKVEELLEKSGSSLTVPEKPATILER